MDVGGFRLLALEVVFLIVLEGALERERKLGLGRGVPLQ